MENNTQYFANTSCKYYPCHKYSELEKGFNCLFCYCPMYRFKECLGHPQIICTKDGKRVKDCTDCTFPHRPENYDLIMDFLMEQCYM